MVEKFFIQSFVGLQNEATEVWIQRNDVEKKKWRTKIRKTHLNVWQLHEEICLCTFLTRSRGIERSSSRCIVSTVYDQMGKTRTMPPNEWNTRKKQTDEPTLSSTETKEEEKKTNRERFR